MNRRAQGGNIPGTIDFSSRMPVHRPVPRALAIALGALTFFLFAAAASAADISITYGGFAGGCLTSQSLPAIGTGISGLGSDTVVAASDAYYGAGPLPGSSNCTVTLSDELIAGGPAGAPGFLSISLVGDAEGMVAPFYVNGVEQGGCRPVGCQPAIEIIPVTLGVPFEIQVAANAGWAVPHQCCFGASDLQATIQVYDSLHGMQTLSEVSAAPEPGTLWLVLLGSAVPAYIKRKVVHEPVE